MRHGEQEGERQEAERDGTPALYERLTHCDPEYADRISPTDLRRIVRALEVKLVGGAAAHKARLQTHNPEAYDSVLRGREQYRLFSKDSNAAARELYERAIALDPSLE